MINPGAINVNSMQSEKVRGAKAPSIPKEPSIPAIGVAGAPKMPRYSSFRKPRTVGMMNLGKAL
jgi:hypothetical protein